jgi:hypothetical protein
MGINLPTIPALATGTNFVPRDMLAYLHEGEAVVPKEFNPAAGSNAMLDIDGLISKIASAFGQAQPQWRGAVEMFTFISVTSSWMLIFTVPRTDVISGVTGGNAVWR